MLATFFHNLQSNIYHDAGRQRGHCWSIIVNRHLLILMVYFFCFFSFLLRQIIRIKFAIGVTVFSGDKDWQD